MKTMAYMVHIYHSSLLQHQQRRRITTVGQPAQWGVCVYVYALDGSVKFI